MTLASSGEISIGGTVANRSINVELGLSATANSSLNQANFRSLAGVGGSGTPISMSSFWGKSAISLASLTNVYGTAFPGGNAYAEIIFNPNGSISYGSSNGSGGMGNWASSAVGSSYWIRFTQTSSYGGSTEYGSGRGVWNSMGSVLYFGVSRTANGAGGRYYTVQIASDSGGSNIVATATGIGLEVEIIF
jgi:hypothetical protein